MPTTAAPLVKAAIYTALVSLYSGQAVTVLYGPRGPVTADDVVSVAAVRTIIEVVTIAPTRPRDEHHEVDVVFDCARSGPETSQQTTTERAYALLALLDAYLQTSPNETLGITGANQTWARLSAVALDEPQRQTAGRAAVLTATVTVRTRI